ncbi:P-loop containing nucleoside triphosphate hydrolase protein [Apiospora marii]|uniref:P-loop containing nucleoside triphosphate hydrolase protein n=1 Tax=Apiospora marii TaxID=335849 RepID=A0ABR1R4C9_9PEZI
MGSGKPRPSPVRPTEDVNYTISQDRTAGQHAQEESNYKLLAGSASNAPPRARYVPTGPPTSLEPSQPINVFWGPEFLSTQKQGTMLRATEKRSHGEVFGESSRIDKVKRYSGDHEKEGGDKGVEHDKHDKEAAEPTLSDSCSGKPEKPSNYRHCVLHRVICSEHSPLCHERLYQDEPHKITHDVTLHLAGDSSVADLDEFVSSRGGNVSFIIIRDFHCKATIRSSLDRHVVQRGTKYDKELVSIVSEDLHATIQGLSKFEPDEYFDDELSLSEYSLQFLYHHRHELVSEAEKSVSISSLKDLTSYVLSNPDVMYSKCDNLFSQGLVSHDTLGWLFQPNEILVLSEGPRVIASVLKNFRRKDSQLHFSCWNWGYDGHHLQRNDQSIEMNIPVSGVIRIDTLDVYPLKYATEETVQRLRNNGDKFWGFSQPKCVSYEGLDYLGDRMFPPDSRFMLDYQVYFKFHPNSEALRFAARGKSGYDSWPVSIPNTEQLSDIHKILLPPGIHGFYLKEKKWIHLLVDNIQPVSWNKIAFDKLVLPKRTKSLVKGLVIVRKQKLENISAHGQDIPKQDDIIAGKGNGLIMLLHGGPGTGKTLTAVLLLDEADVFLEERSLSDLERNSLVSGMCPADHMFLRTLEYYEGVLILTSNRVGTFDEAFKSRIQLALHYRPLDGPSRRKIWNNFFNMIRENNDRQENSRAKEAVDFDDIAAHMDELAGYEMNGRQIRNSLATARQLALFEKETLDWDRIKDAIEVASDFNTYIKEVHGHTDEQWSRDNKFR